MPALRALLRYVTLMLLMAAMLFDSRISYARHLPRRLSLRVDCRHFSPPRRYGAMRYRCAMLPARCCCVYFDALIAAATPRAGDTLCLLTLITRHAIMLNHVFHAAFAAAMSYHTRCCFATIAACYGAQRAFAVCLSLYAICCHAPPLTPPLIRRRFDDAMMLIVMPPPCRHIFIMPRR